MSGNKTIACARRSRSPWRTRRDRRRAIRRCTYPPRRRGLTKHGPQRSCRGRRYASRGSRSTLRHFAASRDAEEVGDRGERARAALVAAMKTVSSPAIVPTNSSVASHRGPPRACSRSGSDSNTTGSSRERPPGSPRKTASRYIPPPAPPRKAGVVGPSRAPYQAEFEMSRETVAVRGETRAAEGSDKVACVRESRCDTGERALPVVLGASASHPRPRDGATCSRARRRSTESTTRVATRPRASDAAAMRHASTSGHSAFDVPFREGTACRPSRRAITRTSLPRSGDVGDETRAARQAGRERASRRIAVDVEHLAGGSLECGWRDDRDAACVDKLFDERAVDERHSTDKPELGVLAFGAKHPSVDTGEADRRNTASDQRGDHTAIREPAEDGEREIARFDVGHPEAPHEARLHSQTLRPLAHERPAAVHDEQRVARVVKGDDRVERRVVLGADGSADLHHEQVLTWCIRH